MRVSDIFFHAALFGSMYICVRSMYIFFYHREIEAPVRDLLPRTLLSRKAHLILEPLPRASFVVFGMMGFQVIDSKCTNG